MWTVYEHIAGIRVGLHDTVHTSRPIARFMNKRELDTFGWQFDHVHFEVMKAKPVRVQASEERPFHRFGTYCLVCYTRDELRARYLDPIEFLAGCR
jgi:hypothetical protein